MNVQLPSERDLPGHVLRRIEAELVAEVSSGGSERRRRWVVPVSAAAAVVVLLTVVGVLRGTDEDRAVPTNPASAGPSWVGGTPPTGRVSSILPECLKAFGDGASGPIDPADAKLYALHGSPSKGDALIYSDDQVMVCGIGRRGYAYSSEGGTTIRSLHWIAAPEEGEMTTLETSADGQWHRLLMAGRVARNVVSLRLVVGKNVIGVPIQNRAYVYTYEYRGPELPFRLEARDEKGKLLVDESDSKCLTTPDGETIGRKAPTATCDPAVPWP